MQWKIHFHDTYNIPNLYVSEDNTCILLRSLVLPRAPVPFPLLLNKPHKNPIISPEAWGETWKETLVLIITRRKEPGPAWHHLLCQRCRQGLGGTLGIL